MEMIQRLKDAWSVLRGRPIKPRHDRYSIYVTYKAADEIRAGDAVCLVHGKDKDAVKRWAPGTPPKAEGKE